MKTAAEIPADAISILWQTLSRLPSPPGLNMVPKLELWLANLTPLLALSDTCAAWLDNDEQAEVARLHQPADQTRMLLRRGLRRLLLGRHLQYPPERLRFERGPWNKPIIREPVGNLHFSTASSTDWFLLGLAHNMELGVDMENVSHFQWSLDLVDLTCSARERQQLTTLPEEQRRRTFLRLWTAKEAVLKLRGTGFHETANVLTLLENLHPGERVIELSAGPDVVIHVATCCP